MIGILLYNSGLIICFDLKIKEYGSWFFFVYRRENWDFTQINWGFLGAAESVYVLLQISLWIFAFKFCLCFLKWNYLRSNMVSANPRLISRRELCFLLLFNGFSKHYLSCHLPCLKLFAFVNKVYCRDKPSRSQI